MHCFFVHTEQLKDKMAKEKTRDKTSKNEIKEAQRLLYEKIRIFA